MNQIVDDLVRQAIESHRSHELFVALQSGITQLFHASSPLEKEAEPQQQQQQKEQKKTNTPSEKSQSPLDAALAEETAYYHTLASWKLQSNRASTAGILIAA